jgi:hypothetical protein
MQIARLAGADAFAARFGLPQTARPAPEALRALIEERLAEIARHLVEEAAASDDVLDRASGEAYLDDRLRTLGGLLTEEQSARLREAFRAGTEEW